MAAEQRIQLIHSWSTPPPASSNTGLALSLGPSALLTPITLHLMDPNRASMCSQAAAAKGEGSKALSGGYLKSLLPRVLVQQ